MGMVWIALLGGGDYAPEGLAGFGMSNILNVASYQQADFQARLLHTHWPTPVWPTFSVAIRLDNQSTPPTSPEFTLA